MLKQLVGCRTTLDHCPLILDTNLIKWGPSLSPFRFENMWLEHPRFAEFVKGKWTIEGLNGWEEYKFSEKLKG